MTTFLQSQHDQNNKKVWQGHKPKPSSKSILRSIAKAKGRGK
ncbi:hypothetical protein [Devosia sp.]|nr:hypothetical protein [Devosia sp.]